MFSPKQRTSAIEMGHECWWATLVLALAGLGSPNSRAETTPYQFYDLGYLGLPYTGVNDLNDLGVAVGASAIEHEWDAHAISWSNGVMTDLSTVDPDFFFFTAEAISQNGVIAGTGYTATTYEAVIFRDGEFTIMPHPIGCEDSGTPCGINDTGTIAVGYCFDTLDGISDFAPSIYFLESGTASNLGCLRDMEEQHWSEAYGVNDAGVVVGRGCDENRCLAFVWEDGVLRELENTLGGDEAGAFGINNQGTIVGNARDETGYPAMKYVNGVMTAIGDGYATAVNERNQAVGSDIVPTQGLQATLYENGETIYLSEYMPDTWENTWATAINNYGWVVGYADIEDGQGAWLVVPLYNKGDYDGDSDVDLHDFGHFQRCFAAEPYIDGTLHVGCSVFDFDDDVDLDLTDYDAFQAAFTGAITSGW